MKTPLIADLRSDTVTRPSAAMRRAMIDAPVGDVCFGDDPTVARLEATLAERLGKEGAIFMPSGTMSNQVAIAVHGRPGDALLCEAAAHIACWEGGGGAVHAGVQLLGVRAENGLPSILDLGAAVPPLTPKSPRAAAVFLENTHNDAGGLAHGAAETNAVFEWAYEAGLGTHLDGARLFNASRATGDSVADLAQGADTVSICLSKGLGAPIGAVLAGDRARMHHADRVRHRFGGGWRQAGMLAAAGLYALDHHIARLDDDHRRARALADAFAAHGIGKARHALSTNLVYIAVDPGWGTGEGLRIRLAERGVLVHTTGPQEVRLVTHLDFDDAALNQVVALLAALPSGDKVDS